MFLSNFVDKFLIILQRVRDVLVDHLRRSMTDLIYQVEMPIELTVFLRHELDLRAKLTYTHLVFVSASYSLFILISLDFVRI